MVFGLLLEAFWLLFLGFVLGRAFWWINLLAARINHLESKIWDLERQQRVAPSQERI